MDVFLECIGDNPSEAQRYRTCKQTLQRLRRHFRGGRVLDFGASHGPGICALLELGAEQVIGVEPGAEWVRAGQDVLRRAGFGDRAELHHVADTRHLPFSDGHFDAVLVNAVLEHIPQPRATYIREIWRVLRDGGHLIVNETPNKYLPLDVHTTGLWFVPWMPAGIAHRYALLRGRYHGDDWTSSGWRGLGFYELVSALGTPFDLIPENTRPRHRVLRWMGLPASLFDPYPTWVLRKRAPVPPAPTPAARTDLAHV